MLFINLYFLQLRVSLIAQTQLGHKDTARTQRHRETKTHGNIDTGTQRHRDTKIQGHKDTGTQRHRNTKTQGHKYTWTQTQGQKDTA